MSTLFLVLSLVLWLIMLVGLISPKKVVKFKENPTRGKVFFFFGTPSFLFLFLFLYLHESSLEKALKDPENTTELSMRYDNLEAVPEVVLKFKKLEKLDLTGNKIKTLPEFLKELPELHELILDENPIDVLPDWIQDLKGLAELGLEETNIKNLPEGILNQISINYKETPLWNEEHINSAVANDDSQEDHSESFTEYATRKLLYEDYGFKRKFKKGEIYYNDPITKEQVDKVGETLETLGLFTDEKEVSTLLDKTKEGVYELRMVIQDPKDINDEITEIFSTVRVLIKETSFPDDEFYIHLTDDEFETVKVIKE